MQLRHLALAAFALWSGASLAPAAPPAVLGDRPVLWSVHFDAARLRAGAGRELFADLDPILTSLSGNKSSSPVGKLETLAIYGFEPQKGSGDPVPFLADLTFTADGGGISQRFAAISKKHSSAIEDLAGSPSMHFQHEGREVWIAKFSDTRVLVGTSRSLLVPALAAGTANPGAGLPPAPTELLGGNVEIQPLLAGNPAFRDSELLRMLPHLDFHVLSDGARFDLDASADLDSERSARRAAHMIDGMVAGVAMRDPSGVPWDERLALRQEGARLVLHLHLEPQEAKKLLDQFAHEIQNRAKSALVVE